ncbi:alpha-mannosidase [Scheffersomyces xylosifermentans]|uniref:alpha-mannosidase n=1 Tax=Scheffersomyces xylosifermentans TaxID=1304137 RepID=UPI00315CB3A9
MLFYLLRRGTFIFAFLIFVHQITASDTNYNSSFTPDHIRYLQNETQALFVHAWSSYMEYGFPADEVRPITCEPYGPDYEDINNTVRNDAMGNISSTVLDNLDTLVIMEQWDQLESMLSYLKNNQQDLFEQDTIVQVFELSIRSLGGLLSAHLLLTDITNNRKVIPPKYIRLQEISKKYDGFLLEMAYDLGLRLIPAYKTSTNIPVPRVNLAKGVRDVPPPLQRDACTSGATTPVLEFTLLSRLTGDPQFESYTQLTFWKLWTSKSTLNLLPMTLDPIANTWKDTLTGIGASIDSFYEYAAKASIIFDDKYMWSVFKTSYKALLTHSAQGGGPFEGSMIFPNVGTNDGALQTDWIDSLGAFWAGLQVLTGQVTEAIKTHMIYLKLWNYFESIPERWVYVHFNKPSKAITSNDSIALEWYPLRPEFIESTYYLYRATKDPMYLQIGERVLNLFKNKFKTTCGFNGIQDVRTGELQNRMETFVMGETLKYLYLLFDTKDEVFLHSNLMSNKNWVFSTEAHPLWFNKHISPSYREKSNKSDEVYQLKRPFFQKIMSLMNSEESLISTNDSSYFRNITLPQAADFQIPAVKNLQKRDPFVNRFEVCETNPFNKNLNSVAFLKSGFYSMDYLFSADYSYRNSLIKPDYLSETSLDNSYVELTPSFFDKFTMYAKNEGQEFFLQCPRPHTTERYELFMGDISQINQIEVSELYYNPPANSEELIIMDGDLWVPELNSLRIQFEKLRAGLVDTRNVVISHEFIETTRQDDYNGKHAISKKNEKPSKSKGHTEKDIGLVLRIAKINGVQVKPNSIIWTLPFEPHIPSPGQQSVIDIASDGRVIISGNVVENLMVWYD